MAMARDSKVLLCAPAARLDWSHSNVLGLRPQFLQVEALNFKTKASTCRTLLRCMQPDTYFFPAAARGHNPHTMSLLVKCMP